MGLFYNDGWELGFRGEVEHRHRLMGIWHVTWDLTLTTLFSLFDLFCFVLLGLVQELSLFLAPTTTMLVCLCFYYMNGIH